MLALTVLEGIGLVASVAGLIGIPLGILALRPRWRMRYTTTTVKLVEGLESKVDQLQVTFRGMPVNTVSVTTVLLWNAGTHPLTAKSWTDDTLHVDVVDGIELLNLTVVHQSTRANTVGINGTNEVEFEYLDSGHGAALQAVHTGTTNEDVRLGGRLKGAGVPVWTKPTREGLMVAGMIMAFATFFLALAVGDDYVNQLEKDGKGWLGNVLILLSLPTPFVLFWLAFRPFYHRVPKDLRGRLPAASTG